MELRASIGVATPKLIDMLGDHNWDVRRNVSSTLYKLAEDGEYRSKIIGGLLN